MKNVLIVVFVIVFLLGLLVGLYNYSTSSQGFYFEPGDCPECGTKLIKGVYGAYGPSVCWYCPNC